MPKAKVELRVPGLAAPGLVRGLEDTLSASTGVEYAHVNLGAAKVTIEYDDALTAVDTLISVVKGAGYDASRY